MAARMGRYGDDSRIAFIKDDRVTISHVGDSRAYLIRNGNMAQLTEDHSFVAECMKQGWLTPEQARTHQSRHGLTMALGVEDEVEPETTELSWNRENCLLLAPTDLPICWMIRRSWQIVKAAESPQSGLR